MRRPEGPRESLAWFAGLHGMELAQLLQELHEATQQTDAQLRTFTPSFADTIYHPFFLAGLVVVLSLGCMWGAVNLLLIGLQRNFGGVSYSWILAYGDAMIFGFVGLFIMGFTYQAFPRFKHTELWWPRLAFAALLLMAAGILVQTLAHLLIPRAPSLLLGIPGGFLEFVVMILGVSLRLLPHAYALRLPSARLRSFLFWSVNGAIAVVIVGFLLSRLSGERPLILLQSVAAVTLLAAAIGTPRQFRLFGPVPISERDRGKRCRHYPVLISARLPACGRLFCC